MKTKESWLELARAKAQILLPYVEDVEGTVREVVLRGIWTMQGEAEKPSSRTSRPAESLSSSSASGEAG